jgi:hypothetical protein
MGGAASFRLYVHRGLRSRGANRFRHFFMPRPNHGGDAVHPGRSQRLEHMHHQRQLPDRVQHLGQRGPHPRALAGGKHDA